MTDLAEKKYEIAYSQGESSQKVDWLIAFTEWTDCPDGVEEIDDVLKYVQNLEYDLKKISQALYSALEDNSRLKKQVTVLKREIARLRKSDV